MVPPGDDRPDTSTSGAALAALLRVPPPGFVVGDHGGGVVDMEHRMTRRGWWVAELLASATFWAIFTRFVQDNLLMLGLGLTGCAYGLAQVLRKRTTVRLRPDRIEVELTGAVRTRRTTVQRAAVRAVTHQPDLESGPKPGRELLVQAQSTLAFHSMPADAATWLGAVVAAWSGRSLESTDRPSPPPPVDPGDPRVFVGQGLVMLTTLGLGAVLGFLGAEEDVHWATCAFGALMGLLVGSLAIGFVPAWLRRTRPGPG